DQIPGQVFHAEAVRYRHHERKGAPAVAFHLFPHGGGQVFTAAEIECHVSALARKYFAERSADSSRSSRDERPLSFKHQTHYLGSPKNRFEESKRMVDFRVFGSEGLKRKSADPSTKSPHTEITSLRADSSSLATAAGSNAVISSTICLVALGMARP